MIAALVILATAATAPAQGAEARTAKPKLVCRNYDVTGSLVQKQRVCRSAEAWSKVEEDMQSEAYRINPHITTEHGN